MEHINEGAQFELSVSKGWLASRLDARFDRDYYFSPRRRDRVDRRCAQLVDREFGDIGGCFTESNLGRKPFIASDQVLVGGIQPNLILGMLVGAEFIAADDKDADIENHVLAGTPVGALPAPEVLLEHPIIRDFDERIAEIRREGRRRPIPPFFWDTSGRAAIHGTVTTGLKLFGEDLFLDMASRGENTVAALDWVAEAFSVLVRHYARSAEFPLMQLHVGECAGCMIGADQFARFVLPGLRRLGEELAPIRLHSCGKSDHLLGVFKKIPRLVSLDLGGETSIKAVRRHFGTEFPVSVAPPVELLTASDQRPLLDWAEVALRESENGPLTIVCHLEPGYNVDAVRALARLVMR